MLTLIKRFKEKETKMTLKICGIGPDRNRRLAEIASLGKKVMGHAEC